MPSAEYKPATGAVYDNRVRGLITIGIACVLFAGVIRVALDARAAQQPRTTHGRLFPPEKLGELEGPDRDEWQEPDRIMDALGIADGARVADVGAGEGASTALLGGAGIRVTAVDRYRPLQPDEWPCCDNWQDELRWQQMERDFRLRYPGVTVHRGCAVEAAGLLTGGTSGVDAAWLDADLTYRGTKRIAGAWADALPDAGLLAGAYYVRRFWGDHSGDNSWINVVDGIAAVRATRPWLTAPFTTWHEDWPTWLMFKRLRRPTLEILSAATPDVHWWPDVQAHHKRYAARHGYSYTGATMPKPADRHPVWIKMALLRERLQRSEAEWLFWLDADAIFWDCLRPLDEFVPAPPWEAVFPQWWRDQQDYCSGGAFFVKNCAAVREFIEENWQRGVGGEYGTEEAWLLELARSTGLRTLLVDHRHFNSLPTGGIWRGGEGDFVMHAAFLSRYRTGFLRDLIERAEQRAATSPVF